MSELLSGAKIAIAGLGLMGGSLGLALKDTPAEVVGIEIDPDAAREALRRGAASEVCTADEAESILDDCDLLILGVPAGEMAEVLRSLSAQLPRGCLITDLGGAMCQIEDQLRPLVPQGAAYIPGHPMAGSEKVGIWGAKKDLYSEAWWLLTSSPPELLSQVIESAGARPMVMDAKEHDRIIARTSHLPHLMAHAAAKAVQSMDDVNNRSLRALTGGGFRDTTRVAAGSAAAAADMCLYNKDQLLGALEEAIQQLQKTRTQLRRDDRRGLRQRLHEVSQWLSRQGGMHCENIS